MSKKKRNAKAKANLAKQKSDLLSRTKPTPSGSHFTHTGLQGVPLCECNLNAQMRFSGQRTLMGAPRPDYHPRSLYPSHTMRQSGLSMNNYSDRQLSNTPIQVYEMANNNEFPANQVIRDVTDTSGTFVPMPAACDDSASIPTFTRNHPLVTGEMDAEKYQQDMAHVANMFPLLMGPASGPAEGTSTHLASTAETPVLDSGQDFSDFNHNSFLWNEAERSKAKLNEVQEELIQVQEELRLSESRAKTFKKAYFEGLPRKTLLEELEGKLGTSESQRASLDHKLKNFVKEFNTLKKQKTACEKKNEELATELAASRSSTEELHRELEIVERERQDLEVQLRDALADLEADQSHSEFSEQVEKLSEELQTSHEANKNSLAKNCRLVEEVEQLKLLVKKLQEKISSREDSISLLEGSLQAAAEKKQRKNTGVSTDSAHMISLENSERKSDEIADLKLLVEQLVEARGYRDQKITLLEDQLRILEDQQLRTKHKHSEAITISSRMLKKSEEKAEDMTTAAFGLNKLVETLQQKCKSQEEEVSTLKEKIIVIRYQREGLAKKLKDQKMALKAQAESFTWKERVLFERNSTLMRRLENLDGEREKQDLNLRFLSDELSRLELWNSQLEENCPQSRPADQPDHSLCPNPSQHHDHHDSATISPDAEEQVESQHVLSFQDKTNDSTIKELQNSLHSLTTKYNNTTLRLSTSTKSYFKLAIQHKMLVEELRTQILELEKDKGLRAPLVKFAADSRLSFLNVPQVVISSEPIFDMGSLYQDTTITSKVASLLANGQADAALFNVGLVPAEYVESARETFKELYSISPNRYSCWGPKSSRVVDCQATVKSLLPSEREALNDNDRRLYQDTVLQLQNFHSSLVRDDFEESEEVEALVSRLEHITRILVTPREPCKI
jgi:myosin heavy subunit